MKTLIITLIAICFTTIQAFCQASELHDFSLTEVRLGEGPFLKAQQADMKYILALDPDRLLAPFLIEAGIKSKAERYENWESLGLDGHTCGHFLSALSWRR